MIQDRNELLTTVIRTHGERGNDKSETPMKEEPLALELQATESQLGREKQRRPDLFRVGPS
jgi:hypothetical protein